LTAAAETPVKAVAAAAAQDRLGKTVNYRNTLGVTAATASLQLLPERWLRALEEEAAAETLLAA
jgi:hypothetical protein